MESVKSTSGSSSRWIAVLAVIVLAVVGYFAYDFYSKSKNLEAELEKAKSGAVESEKAQIEAQKIMSDPKLAIVSLKGTEKAPQLSANVYWDSTAADNNVFLVVKNMPKLASDKQYQLWSIINGANGQLQPTPMDLFNVGDDGKFILKTSGPQKADMFAITVENAGNKGGPTLEQLQVIGKTSL